MAATIPNHNQAVGFQPHSMPAAGLQEADLASPYGLAPPSEPLEVRAQQLAWLVEVSTMLAAALDIDSALNTILSRLADRERLSSVRIYRSDDETGKLIPVASARGSGDTRHVVSLQESDLLARTVRNREAVYVPQVNKDARCRRADAEVGSVYAVPLRNNAGVWGVLEAVAEREGGIRCGTRNLIDQVALQATLAIERSDLYRQLRASEDRFRSLMDDRKQVEEECSRLRQQLVQAQKMEALGTLAGGIAHDFNNQLSVMLGFASLARQRLSSDDPLQDSLDMIEQSAQRAADLTRQLLGFARPEGQEIAPVCIDDALDHVRRMAERTFDRNITIVVRKCSEPLWVNTEQGYLEQALLNMCINARDAMPSGGTLTLEATATTVESRPGEPISNCFPGRYANISVQDTGVGIAAGDLPKVFSSFFTTKGPGRGTGLGLAMVYGFVKSHGGSVKVESEPTQGARFTLSLPLSPPPDLPSGSSDRGEIQRGHGTVLVVDDEPLVRAFAAEGLKTLGYQVWVAENGKEALQIFGQRHKDIDLVLLDLVMPELSGLEIFRRMRTVDDRVCVVFASGFSTGEILRDAPDARSAAFIGKPYTLAGLSSALHKARGEEPASGQVQV